MVLPGGISTADRIGKSDGSGWRMTSSARAPVMADDVNSRRAARAAAGWRGTMISVQWACRVRSAVDAAPSARAAVTRLAGTGSARLPQAPRT